MPKKTDTTRRPKGSGSEWQDDNGKYHARKEIAPNPRTGKRRWVTAQGVTKTAARTRLQEKLDKMQRDGELPLTDVPTLDVWCDRWLKKISRNVKPRTLETYASDCTTIKAHLGGMKLDRITGTDIENMCAELGTTRSSKTVHNLFVRIQQILSTAVREKLITTNPALAALPPRYEQADTRILDPGQPGKAIEAAKTPTISKYNPHPDNDDDHDMWALMFGLAFETGMRQGERFAITPNELETRDGIHGINVQWELQALKPNTIIPNWLQHQHITGRYWLIEPKSKQGKRFIPISNTTWIRLWALAGTYQCKLNQLIFTRHGHPLTTPVERRRWQQALTDAKLPTNITMRSARHFFSTHLAETGAPEDARKAIMGHAKITTTAGYTHWTTETLAALAGNARAAIVQSR